jgi:hypothetical protein
MELPSGANIQNRTSLEFEIKKIEASLQECEAAVEDACVRYERLRPGVMECVAQRLHDDCIAYEQELKNTDAAVRLPSFLHLLFVWHVHGSNSLCCKGDYASSAHLEGGIQMVIRVGGGPIPRASTLGHLTIRSSCASRIILKGALNNHAASSRAGEHHTAGAR